MEFGHAAGTWPGDAEFKVDWTSKLGDPGRLGVNLSRICSSPHNGTHSDAPFHVLRDGATSESLPLDAFIGPCRVVDATKVAGPEIPASFLAKATKGGVERVLFKQRVGPVPKEFPRKFLGVNDDLARGLVEAGVQLVGTDAPSIESFIRPGLQTHRALLTKGVAVLENLDLSGAKAGEYELVALPLKVSGLCAAPVRALLRPASLK